MFKWFLVLIVIVFLAALTPNPKKRKYKKRRRAPSIGKDKYFVADENRNFDDLGKDAEKALARALKLKLDKKLWHVLENVTLPYEDGTTQIDLIVISVFGIFVIEVKDFSGMLYTNSGKTWYQYLGKKKYPFQNPHHQNLAHIQALKNILKNAPDNIFKSLAVFMGSAKFKEIPENTFTSSEEVISQLLTGTPIIDTKEIVKIIGIIEYSREYDLPETDIKHIKYLRKKFANSKVEIK